MLFQLILFAVILGSGWLGLASFTPPPAVGTVVLAAGVAVLVLAFASLSESLSPYPEPRPGARFVERGPYRVVRHPMYSGVILTFAGFSLRSGSWVAVGTVGVLAVFFWHKSSREEASLRRTYPEYEAYARRVRARLIPFVL